MPVYEYRCPDCTHLFEKLVSFSASGDVHCPTCGTQPASCSRRLRRLGWLADLRPRLVRRWERPLVMAVAVAAAAAVAADS